MAKVTKCMVCQKCKFPELRCEIYKKGIPYDIVNELADCKHYEQKSFTSHQDDDELPTAKGR